MSLMSIIGVESEKKIQINHNFISREFFVTWDAGKLTLF